MPTFFEALNDLMAAEVPLVTVTIVDTVGSVPQDRGAKAIVTADGLVYGTVGGGKVETKAIAEAQRMLRGEIDDNTHFAQWNLQKDVGMTCGGVVKLYFETHNVARWQIWTAWLPPGSDAVKHFPAVMRFVSPAADLSFIQPVLTSGPGRYLLKALFRTVGLLAGRWGNSLILVAWKKPRIDG